MTNTPENLNGNGAPIAQHAAKAEPWYKKVLTPKFRIWAYGVSVAGITVGATLAGKPEFIPVIAPLIMAIFFVDTNGDAK